MKILHLTDLHLNHADMKTRLRFYKKVYSHSADYLMVGGDTGDSPQLMIDGLIELANCACSDHTKILFTCGNHDAYNSSLQEMNEAANGLAKQYPDRFTYLDDAEPTHIQEGVVVTGQGLWYDMRNGDGVNSIIELNDFRLVEDLAQNPNIKYSIQRVIRSEICKKLSDKQTENLKNKLEKLSVDVKEVIIVTHVPPFAEAAWFMGKQSSSGWVTYMSSKNTGEMLNKFADSRPSTQINVYTGHTHGKGHYISRQNLNVHTGAARYQHPSIAHIIER